MSLRLWLASLLAPEEVTNSAKYVNLIDQMKKDVSALPVEAGVALQQLLNKEAGQSYANVTEIKKTIEDKKETIKDDSKSAIAWKVMQTLFEGSEIRLLGIIKELGAKAYPTEIHRALFPKGTTTTVSKTDIAYFLHLMDALDITRSKTLISGKTRIRQFSLTTFGEKLLKSVTPSVK